MVVTVNPQRSDVESRGEKRTPRAVADRKRIAITWLDHLNLHCSSLTLFLSSTIIVKPHRALKMGQKRARKTSVKKGPKKEPGKGSDNSQSERYLWRSLSTLGRKRQKITHEESPTHIVEAHKQMKRGILERIADVPVDILCEVYVLQVPIMPSSFIHAIHT